MCAALAPPSQCQGSGDVRVWLFTAPRDLRGNPFRAMTASGGASDRDAAASLTLSDLDRAFGQLPEYQRAIIVLLGRAGMTYNQAAAIVLLSVGTLKSRNARALERLCRAPGVEPHMAQAAGFPSDPSRMNWRDSCAALS